MKKLALSIFTLVISANIYAATDINAAFFKGFGQSSAGNSKPTPTMVYGGKDIAQSLVSYRSTP